MLACIPLCGFTQNNTYFNRTYDFNQYPEGGMSVFQEADGYITFQFAVDTINYKRGYVFNKLDSVGNLIWRKEYFENNASLYPGFSGGICKIKDGYILTGDKNISGDADVILWKFDNNLDTLWTKTYIDSTNWAAGRAVIQTPEGGFVITGDNPNSMILKTDSMGNMIWQKGLPGSFGASIVNAIDSSGYVIGAGLNQNQGLLIKTDTAGAVQWTNYYPEPYDDAIGLFVNSTPDGYIFGTDSIYYETVNNTRGRDWVARCDANGNTMFRRSLGFPPHVVNKVGALHYVDSTIVGMGTSIANFPKSGSWQQIIGTLFKLTDKGDSSWYRGYSVGCDTMPWGLNDQYFRDFKPTFDGGYIMTGFVSVSCQSSQNLWVVKTNCLGFDAPPEAYFVSNADTASYNISFTNASEKTDDVIWNYGDGTADTVHVGDSLWHPTHTYPTSGQYIVTQTAFACGDTAVWVDTVFATAVGISELQNSTVRMYPNPAQNQITLKGLGVKQSKISISNVVGQRLVSVTTNYTKTAIEVTQLPQGVYFVEVSQGGKIVHQQTLIIEN